MATEFSVIVDDFVEELRSLDQIVSLTQDSKYLPKTRISSMHAVTLLLAANFEEFIRQMAKQCAISVVQRANDVSEIPDLLMETAWKRTLDQLVREKFSPPKKQSIVASAQRAKPKIDAMFAFVSGDRTQDIYDQLIHNENNMRPREINGMFKIAGFSDICRAICKQNEIKLILSKENEDSAHGEFMSAVDAFFNRRNEIAHSINSASSVGPDQMRRDIRLFEALARDLCVTLEESLVITITSSTLSVETNATPTLRQQQSRHDTGWQTLAGWRWFSDTIGKFFSKP